MYWTVWVLSIYDFVTWLWYIIPLHYTGHQCPGCWEWTLGTGGSRQSHERKNGHRYSTSSVHSPQCHQGQSYYKPWLYPNSFVWSRSVSCKNPLTTLLSWLHHCKEMPNKCGCDILFWMLIPGNWQMSKICTDQLQKYEKKKKIPKTDHTCINCIWFILTCPEHIFFPLAKSGF